MGPDDVTAESMSAILETDVTEVASERIGDGLVGLNLRVSITSPDADAPESLVVKLPSLDEKSRLTAIALRNYEREVKFYDHIAATVDIRIPQCFHGEWDESSGDFLLVLEDMRPAEQGDQIAGCDVATALTAVRELARLHGPRWDDPTLDEHEFLTRRDGPDEATQLAGLWAMFVPGFLATYRPRLSDDALKLVEEFGSRVEAWVERPDGPRAVTHGDYRLDNLLFATEAGGPPVTAVDWQTPGHGSPIADLAYFCGAGLIPDDRRRVERNLVAVYIEALGEYGIDVDDGWVWEQYARHAFGGVIMAVVASQVVGGSDRSEAMFGAMATRHLQHCLDLESLDRI